MRFTFRLEIWKITRNMKRNHFTKITCNLNLNFVWKEYGKSAPRVCYFILIFECNCCWCDWEWPESGTHYTNVCVDRVTSCAQISTKKEREKLFKILFVYILDTYIVIYVVCINECFWYVYLANDICCCVCRSRRCLVGSALAYYIKY